MDTLDHCPHVLVVRQDATDPAASRGGRAKSDSRVSVGTAQQSVYTERSSDEKTQTQSQCEVQGQGRLGRDTGDKTLAELSAQFDVHANQITERKSQLLAQSEAVFMTKAERQVTSSGPTVQELHSKIGELTMENDFLERALGKLEIPSARR